MYCDVFIRLVSSTSAQKCAHKASLLVVTCMKLVTPRPPPLPPVCVSVYICPPPPPLRTLPLSVSSSNDTLVPFLFLSVTVSVRLDTLCTLDDNQCPRFPSAFHPFLRCFCRQSNFAPAWNRFLAVVETYSSLCPFWNIQLFVPFLEHTALCALSGIRCG